MLEEQLIEIAKQPSSAHPLLLTYFGSRIQKGIEVFLPSSSICSRTYPLTMSKLVFSIISLTTKESSLIFGDDSVYTNRVVQCAEWEIEFFVRLIKDNAPSSETVSALRAASMCVQASLNYYLQLESEGFSLMKLSETTNFTLPHRYSNPRLEKIFIDSRHFRIFFEFLCVSLRFEAFHG